jgi:hypothetical protein
MNSAGSSGIGRRDARSTSSMWQIVITRRLSNSVAWFQRWPSPYKLDSSDQASSETFALSLPLFILYQKVPHEAENEKKMTRTLLVAVLYLSSVFMVSVSAASIPFTLGLSKRMDRDRLPRRQFKETIEENCTAEQLCPSGYTCWYVFLPINSPFPNRLYLR